MSVVTELRVEYLHAPIGIGTRKPRLSWTVDHAQDAYEVEVATGCRAVWATGIVETAEHSLIEYAGERIDSNTAYRWRVRSRSRGAWTPWAASTFDTALLDAADWVAAW